MRTSISITSICLFRQLYFSLRATWNIATLHVEGALCCWTSNQFPGRHFASSFLINANICNLFDLLWQLCSSFGIRAAPSTKKKTTCLQEGELGNCMCESLCLYQLKLWIRLSQWFNLHRDGGILAHLEQWTLMHASGLLIESNPYSANAMLYRKRRIWIKIIRGKKEPTKFTFISNGSNLVLRWYILHHSTYAHLWIILSNVSDFGLIKESPTIFIRFAVFLSSIMVFMETNAYRCELDT